MPRCSAQSDKPASSRRRHRVPLFPVAFSRFRIPCAPLLTRSISCVQLAAAAVRKPISSL
jgi:hypothetical protein